MTLSLINILATTQERPLGTCLREMHSFNLMGIYFITAQKDGRNAKVDDLKGILSSNQHVFRRGSGESTVAWFTQHHTESEDRAAGGPQVVCLQPSTCTHSVNVFIKTGNPLKTKLTQGW